MQASYHLECCGPASVLKKVLGVVCVCVCCVCLCVLLWMSCVVIIVVVVLLVASALASMRWLLCGEKMRVQKKQNNICNCA